jgi:catechol 2,3-dioxygenase-like lactoylglutathione lyase family enzyme
MQETSQSIPITGIHHYTISVTDLEQSVAWYRRVLGFEQLGGIDINRAYKLARLRNGNILLHLIQAHKPLPLPSYRSHPATDNAVQGHKHCSLRVNDGALAEQELRALGAEIVFVPKVNGTYGIFILDPTGNLIEILQEKLIPTPADAAAVPGTRPIVIHGWSHICISVPAMDQSINWYTRVFGLALLHSDSITAPDGHNFMSTWLGGPHFSLEIFKVAGSAPLPQESLHPDTDIETPGNKYPALSVERLDAAEAACKKLGVEIVARNSGGPASLFIRDNAGILLELLGSGHQS